jgi:hypothetical protein
MRLIFASAVLTAMAAAQVPPHKDRSLGYDDTPFLPDGKWRVHDVTRPRPKVITPGAENSQAPSDAIVLFDGTDLSKWETYRATPAEVHGNSQCRGNSGVMLMSRYEIQVLDSYDNPTYADGQAAAIRAPATR